MTYPPYPGGEYQQGSPDPAGGRYPYPAQYPAPPPGGYTTPGYGTGYGPPAIGEGDPLISPDYAGWWRRAMAIVQRAWPALATLQAIALVANILLQAPLAVYTEYVAAEVAATAQPETFSFRPFAGVLGFGLLGVLISIVIGAMVTLASTHVGMAVALGREPSVGAAVNGSMHRVFPLIGWQLLAGLIIVAGLCACVLPGLYFFAVFAVLPVVVAFERVNAVVRCFTLFHHDLGSALARAATVIGIMIAAAIVGSVLGQVGTAIAQASTGSVAVAAVASTTLSAVVSSTVAVLIAPLLLTAYADVRARLEPLSTGVLAREIGMGEIGRV